MKTLFFVFPCMNILLEAPEEILDQFSLVYPHYLQKHKPDFIHHEYRIQREGEKWFLRKDGQTLNEVKSTPHSVLSLEYEIELSLLRLRKNWLAIHAGCVAMGNKACLVAGNPESGKTTTTFHLIEMGHRFMCEEIAFVDPETQDVIPFLQTLPLDKFFLDEVKKYFSVEKGDLLSFHPYIWRYSAHSIVKQPTRLETLLLPTRDRSMTPGLVSLSPSEAFTEFLGYCFEPTGSDEEFFDSVIRVLGNCRMYRLCYWNAEDCRQILLEAFPSVES